MKIKLLFSFAFLLAASFASAQGQEKKMSPKEIKLLIDSIGLALKRWYIYPDKAAIIDKQLNANYKSGAYSKAKDQRDLALALQTDIQKAHRDGHMRIFYDPGFATHLMTTLPDSIVKQEEEMELSHAKEGNFTFVKTEILPGNIGYLRWDGFVQYTQEAQPTYESAFRFVSNAKALIIDMRFNGGGSPETVNAMLNYFFDKKLPMNHIIDHKHDTVKFYTDPSKTSFKLKMPVYVLTSRRTFSGAEDFTYAMKYAQRAIIVGDTTGGGAHPTGPFPVGQGFVLNIPNARSYHEVTKTNWEGKGIWPDLVVNSDLALFKAQLLALKDLAAKAPEDEKANLAWSMTVAENKLKLAQLTKADSLKFNTETLKKYCGEFMSKPVPGASPFPLSIMLKGDHLYRHITLPPDMKLIPISSTRFIYDDDEWNRYVDFTFDKEDNVSGFTIYRADGVFPYERVK